ncbi:hypothetical protein OHD60_31695 [Escherichia coli]|nr:hypothetical protein [Escherichia coli]
MTKQLGVRFINVVSRSTLRAFILFKISARFRLGMKERRIAWRKARQSSNNMRRILSLNVLLRITG